MMRSLAGIIALMALLAIAPGIGLADETRLSGLRSTIAESCDVPTFNYWVSMGLDPDTTANGGTLLIAAITCGGANVRRADDATKCADISKRRGEMVRAVLRAGANPNQANDDGYTPIMEALLYDCTEDAIRELLIGRANPMLSESEYHTTALDIAMQTDVVPIYLEQLLGDIDENTPLTISGLPPVLDIALQYNACGEGQGYNTEKFKLLLQAGARKDVKAPADYSSFSNIAYAGLNLEQILKRRIDQQDPPYKDIQDCLGQMLAALS